MSASALLLTAGFAGLVTLGIPFAIAIGVVVMLVLTVADIEPAFLAQQLVAILIQLGMSPSARTKLTSPPTTKPSKFERFKNSAPGG